ncbi:glycosyltransferase involved in cell wall biosynthesis [Hoeflea marina]|uniref:Glycosyltransferase involved in cell wall biosynthesis n=1 Tax=Hoeflea marina TaxID=274592 RepID=A0A317PMN9_9HYPH|nr:glycosyltransferase [Hoeflea marina]PWW00317.1 glycosyltransferase involved in cell wall biosynthesis [Hoeflea marina]
MKLVHITPHLGGGVGKAHAALCAADDEAWKRRYVLLEAPRDPHYADLVRASGATITVAPDAAALDALMRAADLVQFEWWNHPLLLRLMAWTDLPPMRSVAWSHVSGLHAPLIPPGLIGAVDRFLFTSACSLLSAPLSGVLAANAGRIGVVNSGFGFPRPVPGDTGTGRAGRVSYLGTVDFAKMSPAMFEVIDRLEADVVVDLHGAAADDSPVRAAVAAMRHPGRVRLCGHSQDPAAVFAQSSILLYLLQPNHFGTAENALVEAMSLGCAPLVFANACELAIVHDGETGFVVRDVAEAAARLDWMLARPDAVAHIGRRAARDVARNRTPALSLAQLRTTWLAMLDRPRRQPSLSAALGSSPADWYRRLQGLEDDDCIDAAGAPGAASKGSLAHFRAHFPDLEARK